MEVTRIIITRNLTDEPGEFGDLVTVEMPEDFSVLEALGMLRMAEDSLLHDNA